MGVENSLVHFTCKIFYCSLEVGAIWKYGICSTWMHNCCWPKPGLLVLAKILSFYDSWRNPASQWPVESCIHIQEIQTVITVMLEVRFVVIWQDGHQATPGRLLLFDRLALCLVVFKAVAQASLSPQTQFYLPRFLLVSMQACLWYALESGYSAVESSRARLQCSVRVHLALK